MCSSTQEVAEASGFEKENTAVVFYEEIYFDLGSSNCFHGFSFLGKPVLTLREPWFDECYLSRCWFALPFQDTCYRLLAELTLQLNCRSPCFLPPAVSFGAEATEISSVQTS